MDEKKLQELMNDEEFVKQVMSLKTEGEVQEAFKAKGVEISVDEIKKLGEEGKTALEDGSLENVSGGISSQSIFGHYVAGLLSSPVSVWRHFKSDEEKNITTETGDKVATYAGSMTLPTLGVAVCGGLIYGGIKTGAFKKAYGKAQEAYGAAKDKIGGWMSSKEVK